jgi:hypothetical protein
VGKNDHEWEGSNEMIIVVEEIKDVVFMIVE